MIAELSEKLTAIEEIYNQLFDFGISMVAFTATQSGEGVSSIVDVIARRATSTTGKVLVLDLNWSNRGLTEHYGLDFNEDLETEDSYFKDNIHKTSAGYYLLANPPYKRFRTLFNTKDNFSKLISMLSKEYDTILVDTISIHERSGKFVPTEIICEGAQATILIVMAGVTVTANIQDAVFKLTRSGANMIGTIFNDKSNPRLDDELCRETHRLQRFFPKSMRRIRKLIRSKQLFTINL